MAGAAEAVGIEFHDALGHELHHLAQPIDVSPLFGELGKCDSSGGQRDFLQGSGCWVAPQPFPESRWPPSLRMTSDRLYQRYGPRPWRMDEHPNPTPLPGTLPRAPKVLMTQKDQSV